MLFWPPGLVRQGRTRNSQVIMRLVRVSDYFGFQVKVTAEVRRAVFHFAITSNRLP
jgi:hypothetical protein